VLFAPVERATPDPAGRVHLFCHADGGYYLLGVTLAAAGSLQWLRDTLFPDLGFDALVDAAASSPAGAGGVTFLPYLAGERTPHMDPDLRGSWHGLSLASRGPDLVRAVLEGVAFSQRDALEVMQPLAALERLLATGGGSRSPFWLQLVSDAMELPLTRLAGAPGAAYGAALLAHRGSGHEVAPQLEAVAELRPEPAAELRGAYRRYRSLGPRLEA
jgi:xylulokinase